MAAVTKVADLERFENQVLLHSGLPYAVGVGVVALLPWLELTCGLCLALGQAVREAGAITAVLLLAFLGHSLLYPSGVDCHCFFLPAPVALGGWWVPVRNLVLLGCSVRVAWR